LILLITGLSLLIPSFTDFVNIAGALGGATITCIMPPLLYNIEFKDTISTAHKYFNWAIIVFGVVGAVLSLYTSIT